MKKHTATRLAGVAAAVGGLVLAASLNAPFAAADIGGGLPGTTAANAEHYIVLHL